MSHLVVALVAFGVGLVAGWALDRWTLQVRPCEAEGCGGEAPLDVISWRCACGWTKAEEEL